VKDGPDPEEWPRRRVGLANLLLSTGRSQEAVDTLVVSERWQPATRLRTKLTLTEAHLATRNLSAAHDWLGKAQADNAVLNVPFFQSYIEELAAQF
jgi:hypothetical protein